MSFLPVVPNAGGAFGQPPTVTDEEIVGGYIGGGALLTDRAREPVTLPFFSEVLTRNPANPILLGTMVDPTFNLAADPALQVINGKLWIVFETGFNDVAGNVHLNRIYVGSTSNPNGAMDPTFYKISHDDTRNYVAPKIITHNGIVYCFYTEGAARPPGAPVQGILWERHMPVAQFPGGVWSDANAAFDPTLVASWNGITTKRCLDNQAMFEWRGRWFLLCGDSNDAKVYGRWASHFTTDWVNNAQDIAGGGVLLDVADSAWLKTMTEMHVVTLGEQTFLVFGGKRKSDNKRGIVVFALTQLNTDGPTAIDGTWLRQDLAFSPSAAGWDSVDIHCADLVVYKGQAVFAYDARPALAGSTSNDWKVGLATANLSGTLAPPIVGSAERMKTPGTTDQVPLSVPNWRLGKSNYFRRSTAQLLDFVNSFQSYQADTVATAGALAGTLKWYGGVLGPDGVSIYCIPLNSTSVLKINTSNDTTSLIDISGLTGGGNTNKWVGGVLALNGVIYATPFSNTNILRIDTTNADAVSVIDISGLAGAAGTFKWFGAVVAPTGIIYFIPQDATSILRLDPLTDTPSVIDISALAGASATDKWNGAVLAPNGAIYGIPKAANSVLRFDTANEIANVFGAPGVAVDKWIGGVLAGNGRIYGMPYSAGTILEIDPVTDTLQTFGATAAGVQQYMGGVLAPNGFVYGIPRDATTILKVDTVAKTISQFGAVAGTGKWMGGVLANNGFIYGVPRNSTTFLKLLTALAIPTDWPLARVFNCL